MLFPLLVTAFVLFAASRAYLRYKGGLMSTGEFYFWLSIWAAVEIIIWIPTFLDDFARRLGIARGIDAVVYTSIMMLYYLVYRVYIKAEVTDREITDLTRKIAIQNKFNKPSSEQPPR
jgi:hypothetical protein